MRKLALLALLIVARANAQPAAAQAEVLFRKGKRLLAEGKIADACAAFDASQKLDPAVSTLLNQANCREKNNQLATAWGLFLDAERETRGATDDAGRQLHQVAADHAAKLEPRLSSLTISVSDANHVDGLEVKRDNETIDPAAWNQPLPMDGGTYTIHARAPGVPEFTSKITIANEKDQKTVEIPKLAPKKSEPVAKKESPPPPPPKPPAVKADVPDQWFCTASGYSTIGTCKPTREACEQYRNALHASVRDLTECAASGNAVCFQSGSEDHCTPSTAICDRLRSAAESRGSAVGECETKKSARPVVVAPAPPPKPRGAQWSCTDSETGGIGTCKAELAQCEAFRAKLLERFHDLTPCHDQSTAQCFDVGKDPHCAPSAEICESLRAAAKAGKCYSRAAAASAGTTAR
jgi:hypothetical protein